MAETKTKNQTKKDKMDSFGYRCFVDCCTCNSDDCVGQAPFYT